MVQPATVIRLLFGLRFIRITVLFGPGNPDTVIIRITVFIRDQTFADQAFERKRPVIIRIPGLLFGFRSLFGIRLFIRSRPAGDGYPVFIRITIYSDIIRTTVLFGSGYSYPVYSESGFLFGNRFTVFQPCIV